MRFRHTRPAQGFIPFAEYPCPPEFHDYGQSTFFKKRFASSLSSYTKNQPPPPASRFCFLGDVDERRPSDCRAIGSEILRKDFRSRTKGPGARRALDLGRFASSSRAAPLPSPSTCISFSAGTVDVVFLGSHRISMEILDLGRRCLVRKPTARNLP